MMLVASAVFLLLLLPLVVFFGELFTNPGMFELKWSVAGGDNPVVDVRIVYGGSVPLTDFKLSVMIGGEEQVVERSLVSKGDSVEITLRPPSGVSLDKLGMKVEFKIAGIYLFSIGVKNG